MLQIAIHFHPIHAAVKYIDVLSNFLCNCNKYIINKNNVITKLSKNRERNTKQSILSKNNLIE